MILKFKLLDDEDDDVAKFDITKTIRLDEATHDMALGVMGELDMSLSELIRVSLCLTSPMLITSPFLKKITIDDVNVSKLKECE